MWCVCAVPVGAGCRKAHVELSGGCVVNSHSALMGHVIVRSTVVGRFHISLRSGQVELRARSVSACLQSQYDH
eukprot:2433002-Prymnesium_polylepis.1